MSWVHSKADALKALGRRAMPAQIERPDGVYRLARVFKHDFFAATARYDGPGGSLVLKLGREAPLLGLPLDWMGRWLVGHEVRVYRLVDGLEGVPRFVDTHGDGGFLHEFAPGHDLRRHEWVDDEFFERLTRLIDQIHARGIAYVDLNKRENILVGDDGRPYLIDFQIAFHVPGRLGRTWPARLLRRRFQAADRYHLLKQRRRHRPDQMTPQQLDASFRKGFWIRLHGLIARPLTLIRRRTLSRIARSQ